MTEPEMTKDEVKKGFSPSNLVSLSKDIVALVRDSAIANHEIHSASVTGPWPHDDKFIVGFQYEITNKPSGKRMKMDEVGLYCIKDGKIVREEFYYDMGM